MYAAPCGGEQKVHVAIAVYVANSHGIEAEGVAGNAISVRLSATVGGGARQFRPASDGQIDCIVARGCSPT